MNYYTSDLHFGHSNIIDFENRPFKNVDEMNFELIRKWNNKVCDVDDVYVLGDMFHFKDVDSCLEVLNILNGKKHLIVGNHDEIILNNPELSSKFESIDYLKDITDDGTYLVLCHYPIQVWNKKHLGSLHLFGHVHSNTSNWHPMKYNFYGSFNVCVDVCNFEPYTLKELIERDNYVR